MSLDEALLDKVAVCDSCLRASCWQGVFYCDDYRKSGIEYFTKSELSQLNREHPSFWKTEHELSLK